ncbi:hypothetical protein ACHAXS_006054 [Conticribra weissflogii]
MENNTTELQPQNHVHSHPQHHWQEHILSLLTQCQSQTHSQTHSQGHSQSHHDIHRTAPSEASPKPSEPTSSQLQSKAQHPATSSSHRSNLNYHLRKIYRELRDLASSHCQRGTTNEPCEESQNLQAFLYKVARELIHLDRVVASVDDEINGNDILIEYYHSDGFVGDFGTGDGVDYAVDSIDKNYCEDAPGETSSGNYNCDKSNKKSCQRNKIDENSMDDAPDHDDAENDDPEQWIDRCLDLCGYAISLEVAVDCLRDVVATKVNPHLRQDLRQQTKWHSSTNRTGDEFATEGNGTISKPPGLPAVISSLRTIRRRLLPPPSSPSYSPSFSLDQTNFPIYFLDGFQVIRKITNQFNTDTLSSNLRKFVILPLEYFYFHSDLYSQKTDTEFYSSAASASPIFILSDSLVDLATSVLPTLVSSACHAMDLPLPVWVSPKKSLSYLLHCAWCGVMVAEMWKPAAKSALKNNNTDDTRDINAALEMVSSSTSDYFQSLMRRMIHLGYIDLVVRRLYGIWMVSRASDSSADFSVEELRVQSTALTNSSTAQSSILCIQLQSTLSSISSKREVANVIRKMVLHAAKQIFPTATAGQICPSSTHYSEVISTCQDHVLRFLESLLLPSLVNYAELREVILNLVILSPPSSFFQPQLSGFSFQTLHILDRIVPICLAHLLASACCANKKGIESTGGIDEEESLVDESDEDQDSSNSLEPELDPTGGFLPLVIMVASVWSEEVFITRTDTMQQQYVTEFLLQSFKCNTLEQNDISYEISGSSLAATLVQGITLRLEVSRAESIRIDGMRIAEAMSSLIGQSLRFDELHPSDEGQEHIESDRAKCVVVQKNHDRRRTKKNKKKPKKAPLTLDPDAEYVSDAEESSDSDDGSSGVDSLESDASSICSSTSSWGEDSLEPYVMDDDEEDLRPVPRPRSLRECFSYLIESENETLAYDKHEAALMELPAMVSSRPLDLFDMTPALIRILLHMEDKFNMENFMQMKMDSLMALAVHAPMETCFHLVDEIGENVSLGTRLEALTILGGMAQELSGLSEWRNRQLKSQSTER